MKTTKNEYIKMIISLVKRYRNNCNFSKEFSNNILEKNGQPAYCSIELLEKTLNYRKKDVLIKIYTELELSI